MKIVSPKINLPEETAEGIRVENVTHFYGSFPALRAVSFEVQAGEVCVILGPNGAGKTTLLRLLTGFFLPKEGRIFYGSNELTRRPLPTKRRIGYLPEHFPCYRHLTVREFLDLGLALKGFEGDRRAERQRVLERTGIQSAENRMISKLSKGLRQRAALAGSLLGDPPYLILDEPTSGMDPEQIRSMRRMIRELKGAHTVILSTHILAEAAQVADRIVILSEGDLISSGRPSELESAYLAGENIYRVGFRGRLHEIEEKIARIPEVVSWELIGSSPEHHRGEVRINREIAEGGLPPFFAERGLLVFEYAKKEMHLEDIFLKAVTEERAR